MATALSDAKSGSQSDVKSPVKFCALCNDRIGIIPVRYAIDDVDAQGQPLNLLPESEGWNVPMALKHSTYTLRQIRNGWVYVIDKTRNTFHEYEASSNLEFTLFDLTTPDIIPEIPDRTSYLSTDSCLIYERRSQLYIAYSRQRWTSRVCTFFRDNAKAQQSWMTKVSIDGFDFDKASNHLMPSTKLAERVADVACSDNTLFSSTSTPLAPSDAQSSDSNLLIEHKAPAESASIYTADLPDEYSGLCVALTDRLADTTDLFLKLSERVLFRAAVMGDEEEMHKTQMAEITRYFGRPTVALEKLPPEVREDPIKRLKLEKDLAKYFKNLSLGEMERNQSAVDQIGYELVFTPMAEQQYSDIVDTYGFDPNSIDRRTLKEVSSINELIRWDELDSHLSDKYEKLDGLDEQVNNYYDDFILAFNALGNDPLAVGLDNQEESHQAYMLDLISQFLTILKDAPASQDKLDEFQAEISMDSPKNWFGIASFGFSAEAWKSVHEYLEQPTKGALELDDVSDMRSVANVLGGWELMVSDVEAHNQAWFKALVAPVQATLLAMRQAATGVAKHHWQVVMDCIFPANYQKGRTTQTLLRNLRLLAVHNLLSKEAILGVNKQYSAKRAPFDRKVEMLAEEFRKSVSARKGQVSIPKGCRHPEDILTDIKRVMATELPGLIALQENLKNNALQQTINKQINSGLNGLSKVPGRLGGYGTIISILNIWNVASLLNDARYRANLSESDDFTGINPVYREILWESSFTVAAISTMLLDSSWDKIAKNSSLVEMSIKDAAKRAEGLDKQAIKAFSSRLKVVLSSSLFANALEAYDAYINMNKSDISVAERAGHVMRLVGTGVPAAIYLFKSILTLINRPMVAIMAGWMNPIFFVSSVIYLIGIALVNVFQRSELEKWALYSYWGRDSKGWQPIEEVKNLEAVVNKPSVIVKSEGFIDGYATGYIDGGRTAENASFINLTVHFPSFITSETRGVGLRIGVASQGSYDGVSAVHSVIHRELINEQNGRWVESDAGYFSYTITFPLQHNQILELAVRMPLNFANSRDYLFYNNLSQRGVLNISRSNEPLNTKGI